MAEKRARNCEFEPRCYTIALLTRMVMGAMPDTSQELLRVLDQEANPDLAKNVAALEVAEQSPLPDPPLCKADCPRLIGPATL